MRVGRGSVFKRPDSPFWWVQWYRDGKPFRESSHSERKGDAQTLLARRLGDVSRGAPVSPRYDRLTFDEAAADVLNDFRINGKRSLKVVQRRIVKHLAPYFGGRRMVTISASDVRAYIAKRQADRVVTRAAFDRVLLDGSVKRIPAQERAIDGVSAGEINRELQILKRSFNLAVQAGKLLNKPHIPMLRESNVRTGFFEPEQVAAVLARLSPNLKPLIKFAHITGWRIPSEVLPLQWRNVDFEAGEVRLDAGTTKNGEGRVFPMTPALRSLLEQQRDDTRELSKARGRIHPFVFHRNGEPVRSFTKAFRSACVAAGCPHRIPHDLRRTAVRNMVRAGVPERVAMQLTGHKTRSVFERYNVVSPGDLRNAARLLDSFANDHETITLHTDRPASSINSSKIS